MLLKAVGSGDRECGKGLLYNHEDLSSVPALMEKLGVTRKYWGQGRGGGGGGKCRDRRIPKVY